MEPRLAEMHRLLKDTGSIYLHCDPNASHYLKVMMDTIFGMKHFRNEIVWHYADKFPAGGKIFGRNHDTILFVSKCNDYTFNVVMVKKPTPTRRALNLEIKGKTVDGLDENNRFDMGNIQRKEIGRQYGLSPAQSETSCIPPKSLWLSMSASLKPAAIVMTSC